MQNRNNLMLRAILFEGAISNKLKSKIDGIRIVNNKILECKWTRRKNTEIDLIAVTTKAIYVIEAKNWSGYIEGNYDQFYWRGMGDSHKPMDVISTYMQNLMHVRFIKSAALLAGISLPPVISIICVPDSCQIYSDCIEIVHLSEIVQRIEKYELVLRGGYDTNEILKFIRKCR